MTIADPTRRARASLVVPLTAVLVPRLLSAVRFIDRSRRSTQHKLLYLRLLRTRLPRRRRVSILAGLVLGFLACDGLLLGMPRVGYGAILLSISVFGWQRASRPATTTATEATAPSGT